MIRYRLGEGVAARRAGAVAAVGAAISLAPIVFALVLLERLGWEAPAVFTALAAALAALLVVRAAVGYRAGLQRLRALVILVGDDRLRVDGPRGGLVIERHRVARIAEVDGPLGGLRVESLHDTVGRLAVAQVPRGGEEFGEVRARLESWRPIERRNRRGPAPRFLLGALVVGCIFFVPFLLDDFVAHSRALAAGLVGAMWLVLRFVLTRR